MFTGCIHGWCLLELLVLIDTLFDEDLLQRAEMQLFQQLVLADFQFLAQQSHRAINGVP